MSPKTPENPGTQVKSSDSPTLRMVAAFALLFATSVVTLVRAERAACPIPPPTPPVAPLHAQGTRVRFSGQGLSGTVGLSQSAIAIGTSETVYAEVELNADGTGGGRTRSAIAAVIDTSGSMEGYKMEQAIRGAQTLLQQVNDSDFIAVVQYSDQARPVCNGLVRDVRWACIENIRRLRARGGTNIRAGLQMGASLIGYGRADASYSKRVLLLSDGQDTYNANAYESAQSTLSIANGASISTLGIGQDYDESFMTTVASVGHGNYAFLQNTDRLYAFFQTELNQASQTTADRVRVALRIPSGWAVQRSYGAEMSRGDGTLEFYLGAITRGEPRRVVVELRVPAAQQGMLGQLGANITYIDTQSATERTLSAEGLALQGVPEQRLALASRDMEVFGRSRAMVLAEDQRQAVDAWSRGDAARARTLSQRVEAEANALRAAAPAASAALIPVEEQAREGQRNYDMAPGSAAGGGWGRAARARANASSQSRSADTAAY